MPSDRTLKWKAKYKRAINNWQEQMKILKKTSYVEHWDRDRYEMEVTQLIEIQSMRDVFIFSKNYISKYKRGKFRSLMASIYKEIVEDGTIEPSRLKHIKKIIDIVRGKMK